MKISVIVSKNEAIQALKTGYWYDKIEGDSLYPHHYSFIDLTDWAIINDLTMYFGIVTKPDPETVDLLKSGHVELDGEGFIVDEANMATFIGRVQPRFLLPLHKRLKLSPKGFLSDDLITEETKRYQGIVQEDLATASTFRKWLSDAPPESIVGKRNSHEFCPIAKYLEVMHRYENAYIGSALIYVWENDLFRYSQNTIIFKHLDQDYPMFPNWINRFLLQTDY